MTSYARKTVISLVAAGAVVTAAAAPAQAATKQDGLVNVNVGDVTVLQDVNVAAAVGVVAELCGIDVTVPANLALLSTAAQNVDAHSRNYTVCRTDQGKVKFTQN